MIVDTHVHVISADRTRHPLASNASGWSTEGVVNPIDDLMRLMDAAGVDKAVLVQPAAAYGYDNSYHAESQARYSDRTVSVGLLDPTAPDATDRLQHWIAERGMHGVRVPFGAGSIDDGRADPFWQRATELAIPITIIGASQPAQIVAIANMAARFPGVPLAPDHMAGWSISSAKPAVAEALIRLAQEENAYLRISTMNIEPYEDHSPDEQRSFREVLAAFTERRVMWGSNYPASRVGGYGRQVELARTGLPFLSDEQRAWILGGTAALIWPQLAHRGGDPTPLPDRTEGSV